jgi:hypothetical protein
VVAVSLGFAPLTTRRIVPRETLARALATWQRGGLLVPRRPLPRRRPLPPRSVPVATAAAEQVR